MRSEDLKAAIIAAEGAVAELSRSVIQLNFDAAELLGE